MVSRILIIGVLLVGSWASVLAQVNAPVYSNEFLNLGVGGRSLGMGQAQVGLVDDATAGYWNPAGLTELNRDYGLSLMHASYFAGIANYDVAAFAAKIDSVSAIGITALRFGVDDIPDTRFLYDANGALDYDRIRFFSAADYAFLLSYARKLAAVPGLSVGGNVKIVHRVAGNFAQAWGFGIDLSARYQLGSWSSGLLLRDATGTFNAWNHNTELLIETFTLTGNEIPENTLEVTLPQLVWGNVYHIGIGEQFRVSPALDMAVTFDGFRNVLLSTSRVSIDPRVGLEAAFRELAMLRLGVSNVQRVQSVNGGLVYSWQPNAGLGVRYGKWGVDYAFTDLGDQSEALFSHIVSVQFEW
ncbi:MAG TPA: hypothetical protein DCE41_23635 [Cytophagales bacterium]|nr:hypothetical protein [Cytophagales bacterium]